MKEGVGEGFVVLFYDDVQNDRMVFQWHIQSDINIRVI